MQRVLVTGGSGFVGSRVVRRLLDLGIDVGLLLRSEKTARRLEGLIGRCEVFGTDLADLRGIYPALKEFAPQGVVHLAWAGVGGADRNDSVQLCNVSQAVDLFRLSREVGVAHFVGLGSQAEYGQMFGRVDETAPTRPTTLYGAVKLATGCVLERAASAGGCTCAWLRLFSSYGPDDAPGWLIPYLIRTLLAGEKPSLTACEQLWDYVHVDDAADAVVSALRGGVHGVFNVGSGSAPCLREVVELIRDYIDPSLPLGFGEVDYRPDQIMHLEADIRALRSATGWHPRVSLNAGLVSTIEWYQEAFFSEQRARFPLS